MRAAHQKNMRIIVRSFRLSVVRVFDVFILGKERRPFANIGFPADMPPVRRRGRLARVLRQVIFEKTIAEFKRMAAPKGVFPDQFKLLLIRVNIGVGKRRKIPFRAMIPAGKVNALAELACERRPPRLMRVILRVLHVLADRVFRRQFQRVGQAQRAIYAVNLLPRVKSIRERRFAGKFRHIRGPDSRPIRRRHADAPAAARAVEPVRVLLAAIDRDNHHRIAVKRFPVNRLSKGDFAGIIINRIIRVALLRTPLDGLLVVVAVADFNRDPLAAGHDGQMRQQIWPGRAIGRQFLFFHAAARDGGERGHAERVGFEMQRRAAKRVSIAGEIIFGEHAHLIADREITLVPHEFEQKTEIRIIFVIVAQKAIDGVIVEQRPVCRE